MHANLLDFSRRLAYDMHYASENIKHYERQIESLAIDHDYIIELKDKLQTTTEYFNRKREQLNSVERCIEYIEKN